MAVPFRRSVLSSVLFILATASLATDIQIEGPDCTQTIDTVPVEVRKILNPLHKISPTKQQLADSASKLEALISEADFCRVFVVSKERKPNSIRQYEAREWKSLHLWLHRLANFMVLNAQGNTDRLWIDEYEVFAELYELEIGSPLLH